MIKIAEEHEFAEIEGLVAKYANDLIGAGRPFHAVELYSKANRYTEAAALLAKMGEEVSQSLVRAELPKLPPHALAHSSALPPVRAAGLQAGATRTQPLRAKKLFVLAALEMERMRKEMIPTGTQQGTSTKTATQMATQTLDSLVEQAADACANPALALAPLHICMSTGIFPICMPAALAGQGDWREQVVGVSVAGSRGLPFPVAHPKTTVRRLIP